MDLYTVDHESRTRLSTQDKLNCIVYPRDCELFGLQLIGDNYGKAVYFDEHNHMYWSVRDPSESEVIDPSVKVEPIQIPFAHSEIDFSAEAQREHFLVRGRKDLAQKIQVKHGAHIAIAAIPEIPGVNGEAAIFEWNKKNYEVESRPITLEMYSHLVDIMLREDLPVNGDIYFDNMIIGADGQLYPIDFSSEFAGEENREVMVENLFEMAAVLTFLWNELPGILKERGPTLKRIPIDQEAYVNKVNMLLYFR